MIINYKLTSHITVLTHYSRFFNVLLLVHLCQKHYSRVKPQHISDPYIVRKFAITVIKLLLFSLTSSSEQLKTPTLSIILKLT
jgi:hypothetical protein